MTSLHTRRPAQRHTLAMFSLLVALVVTGCATVSQPPFQQFADSVQKVRSGADSALGGLYDQARDRYVDETAQGGAALQGALLTSVEGDPFAWTSSSSPPLFLQIARFRDGVYRFNSTLVDYAGALAQLASPDLLKPETFDQLATDLNGNLRKALPALGVNPGNQPIAIFSTVATAAFRTYLQNKQRSSLVEALTKNQEAIQNTAGMGQSAVKITVIAMRSEYDLRSNALAQDLVRAGAPAAERSSKARALVDLNDRFIKELAVLRALNQSYVDLPAAHQELAAATGDPKLGIAAIRRLYEQGREMERLYEQLSKDDKKK
jgi:hypothetical protein